MTPEQIREAVGLTPDASEIELAAKLASLGLIPKADAPVVPEVVVEPEPVLEPVAVAEDNIADHPIVRELRESLRQVTEEREQEKVAAAAAARDEFLAQAIRTGRLKPAEKDHFGKLYDAAPDITRETIMARSASSQVPVHASGHSASPEASGEFADFEAAIPDPDARKA